MSEPEPLVTYMLRGDSHSRYWMCDSLDDERMRVIELTASEMDQIHNIVKTAEHRNKVNILKGKILRNQRESHQLSEDLKKAESTLDSK